MSLTGRIEDISVVDTIQYIHASRKSGLLYFEREKEFVEIAFRDGQIVRVFGPRMTNVGDILLREKKLSRADLVRALDLQKTMPSKKAIGAILHETGMVSQEDIRDAIVEQIQTVIAELVGWKEGDFRFEIKESGAPNNVSVAFGDLLLPEQVNTEFLLIEAMRRFDDVARTKEEELKPQGVRKRTGEEKIPLLYVGKGLVDALAMQEEWENSPYEILPITAGTPLDHALLTLFQAPTVAIARVGHPSEALPIIDYVVQREKKGDPTVSLIVLASEVDAEATARLYEHGVVAVIPEIGCEQFGSCAICRDIAPRLARTSLKPKSEDEEISSDFGMSFSLLRMMLLEVGKVERTQEISLQFLNVLSEHMQRAVLFLVQGHELRGIGGFGSTVSGDSINDEAKQLRIKLEGRSLVRQTMEERGPIYVPAPREPWVDYIFGAIGAPVDGKMLLLPMPGVERAICVVYGDNGSLSQSIEHLDLLEIAAAQTGMIIENAFMRKQLQQK